MTAEALCRVNGCGRPVRCDELCRTHYERELKGLEVDSPIRPVRVGWSLNDRLWVRVEKTATCWLWQGARDAKGYGKIRSDSGGTRFTHRVAYELVNGPVPDGLVLDHLCRVPNCVNPDHLEPVTPRENTMRGVGVGALNARKTTCPEGHEYSMRTKRNGRPHRVCPTCRRNQEGSVPRELYLRLVKQYGRDHWRDRLDERTRRRAQR